MFSYTWKKYLPVILILLKRSSKEDQVLNMNHTDFERAAGGKKVKFSFNNLIIKKGRINSSVKHAPLASDLFLALQEDKACLSFLINGEYEFSMTNDFKLLIKNNTPAPEETVPAEESATDSTEAGTTE